MNLEEWNAIEAYAGNLFGTLAVQVDVAPLGTEPIRAEVHQNGDLSLYGAYRITPGFLLLEEIRLRDWVVEERGSILFILASEGEFLFPTWARAHMPSTGSSFPSDYLVNPELLL